MGAGAILLLLFALLGISSSLNFYGDSFSFMPPQKRRDGTFKVTFYHRQNGRSSCVDQLNFTCAAGVCTSFDKSAVLQTDQDGTGQGRWCQSEGETTATISANETTFSLMDSGCCWVSNLNGMTNWNSDAELDLGSRSDSHSLNGCPVTTTVSSLRVPQNCWSKIPLLAYDPDGDHVRCSFATTTPAPANFAMDETTCSLKSTGQVQIGVHVFEVILQDFPRKNITLTYTDGTSVFRQASDTTSPPLCKVKLQFSLEILPPISDCAAGHARPMFLSRTPSHRDVLHATVGQKFELFAEAQAEHASINDFQVSGPHNITKVFKQNTFGKAEVTLSWTPQHGDLYRIVPVCLTAETNETQSTMRCVVVMVTQGANAQGKATVTCAPNKMTVVLEKASMPGIDENYLKLRDSTCSLTSNGTHIMGTMSFSTCGTRLEDKGDFLAFVNEINSFELPSEIIVRRKKVKIDFSCQFPKTISISSYYNLHKSDYIFTESSFGSFGYTFDIYSNSNFTDKVPPTAYPVEVKLLDTIYMGIQAESQLPNVTLFVESCKATPDDNPDNSLSYDIIKNGCLEDETVRVYASGQTTFNFEVQAFKFTGNYDQVYITCSVLICEPGNTFSRCAQGCVNSARRRRRSLQGETVGHYITQGPLQFVGPASTNNEMNIQNNVVKIKSDQATAAVNPLPLSKDLQPVPQDLRPVLEDLQPVPQDFRPVLEDLRLVPQDLRPVSEDTKSSQGRWGIREILNTNMSTMVFASAFLVSLVVMAVVVWHFLRKSKAEDRQALLASDWEK